METLMRSKLFVPASRPELFPKALASDADALSFDLEDAVHAERKDEAREHLVRFLHSPEAQASSKIFIVRVNAADSSHFPADLQAVLCPRVDMLNLPKPGDAAEVCDVARAMADIESANGVQQPIRLLLNIETPRALRNAYPLASAHPRVAGLQLGFADLFGPLGISRSCAAAIENSMFMVRMAAGEAGIFVCDSAFTNTANPDGFCAEARRARSMGFIGKSCIHPSQIALANRLFCPAEEEVAQARKVLAYLEQHTARGEGVFVVDGQMIDKPLIARAQRIVDQARRQANPQNDSTILQEPLSC
jgi:citrate lyase subunit beta/citryl-CoA lyase